MEGEEDRGESRRRESWGQTIGPSPGSVSPCRLVSPSFISDSLLQRKLHTALAVCYIARSFLDNSSSNPCDTYQTRDRGRDCRDSIKLMQTIFQPINQFPREAR